MTAYSQAQRFLSVTTPLGADRFLLEKLTGHESISSLYSFQLDLLAEANATVAFDQVLGQPMTVRLRRRDGRERIFSGICARLWQGGLAGGASGDAVFLRYRAELVPHFWLWSKRVQSRIFQQQSIPDILKVVLQGLNVSYAHLTASYQPRNYCVQYRESDFAFASRLMEEEGIFYYFEHAAEGERLVLVDHVSLLSALPAPDDRVVFEQTAGLVDREAIASWEKAQEVAVSAYRVRDRSFEVPHSTLEAESTAAGSVAIGPAQHPHRMAGNQGLFVYEHRGEFANRFDGVGPGGDERPAELQKVFQENQRTAHLRMEEETARSLRVEGSGNCAGLLPGHRFHLEQHAQGKGEYLTLRVEHIADQEGGYRSGGNGAEQRYQNRFTCLPAHMAYRPPRVTPRPHVEGTVTATVSGHETGEIFTDKYGRVKVLFHWDRDGRNDGASSCWIRVMQPWAGQGWGALQLPRVGQEVVVDFLEGNPDRPIILGGVYNAEQMPAYPLPEKREVSGIRSHSHQSSDPEAYNEIRMEDTPDHELLHLQAQKDMATAVEHDHSLQVDHDSTVHVKHNATTTVGADPLTMNFVTTWNNIELDKLTKTVVVGGVHSEADGVKLEVAPLRFVGVVGAQVHVVGPLLVEKVIGMKYESVTGKKTETVSGNKTESVGGVKRMTTQGNVFDVVEGRLHQTVRGGKTEVVRDLLGASKTEHLIENEDFTMVASSQCVLKSPTMAIENKSFTMNSSSQCLLRSPAIVIGPEDQEQKTSVVLIGIREKAVASWTDLGIMILAPGGTIELNAKSIRLVADDEVSIQTKKFSVKSPEAKVETEEEVGAIMRKMVAENQGAPMENQKMAETEEEAMARMWTEIAQQNQKP